MKKCLVVEDSRLARKELVQLLNEINTFDLIEEASNGEDAIAILEQVQPDVIFLDIHLPGMTGFDFLESIKKIPKVIFTTAYDEYALQAFKLNSIDYLLKPIDDEELEAAVNQYKIRLPQQQSVTLDFNEIKKMLSNPIEREYKKRFSVKIGQHLKLINIDEIECFYSENKGTYLHTSEGRNYLLDTTLEQLEDELEPHTFFRINRKFFVNIHAIKDMISYTNSRLQIKLNSYNEQDVIVARERVKSFKTWLE